MSDTQATVIPIKPADTPMCADHDDECPNVRNKTVCWLYEPARGYCPYLIDAASAAGENP